MSSRTERLATFLNGILHSPALCWRPREYLGFLLSQNERGQYGKSFLAFKLLLYLYLVLFFARFLFLGYFLANGGTPEALLPYDPIAGLAASKSHSVNAYSSSLIGLFLLYCLYIDYSLFFQTDEAIIKVASDLILHNTQNCSTAEGNVDSFSLYSKRFWTFLLNTQIESVTFREAPLETLPHLSPQLRLRLVKQSIAFEAAISTVNLLTVSAMATIWTLALAVIWTEVPPLSRAHATLDLTLLLYCGFNAIRLTYFGFNFVWTTFCLITGYMAELHGCLVERLLAYHQKPTRARRTALECQISNFTTTHAQLRHFCAHLNRQSVSGIIQVAFFTNILINVVVLNLLLVEEMQSFEKASIIFFLGLQSFVALGASQFLASISEALYRSDGFFYQVQSALGIPANGHFRRHILSIKLHLMTFYEEICTKEPFTFTVGALAKVSKQAIFEFLLGYSGFFMYISQMLRELHLEM